MNKTAINWTDLTWNPMSGCRKISAECAFCYAHTLAQDKAGTRAFPHGFELTVRAHKLSEPARVREPSLIFCNSMSDLGLDDSELLPAERDRMLDLGIESLDTYRDRILDAIEATPRHRYQVLTKRPERLLQYLRARGRRLAPSVWMGVTIGDRRPQSLARLSALHRFRDFGATVLFVSAEPLIADFHLELSGVDWLITGGESGRHASDTNAFETRFLVRRGDRSKGESAYAPRADRADWVRRHRDAADRAGCAHWFKQWGGPKPHSAGRTLDGREHNGMPTHVPGAMPAASAQIHLPVIAA